MTHPEASVARRALDRMVERFEKAWQSGRSPRIEVFLGDSPVERRILLVELVHIELEYRLKAGQAATVEEYLVRFPELASTAGDVVALVEAEYQQRCLLGQTPAPEDYLRRFPHHGPQLAGQLGKIGPRPQAGQADSHDNEASSTALPVAAPSGDLTELAIHSPTQPDPSLPRVPGYEVVSVLGRGGMGIVYEARHVKLNRIVALKMIRDVAQADAWQLDRFRAEAEAVARLQHPNIVQIYEIGDQGGLPYFALEYCAGGSLDRQLAGAPQPPRPAAQLVETLARGMQHAHDQHVIHRDLKPANVLLGADGTPKVTDFGLAKKLDTEGQTQTGDVMGTPSYMAPEQAAGKTRELGPAVDVYALGAVLYEMLTGRPPFKGVTKLDTLQQVATAEPVPPSRLQPKTPRDLETICLKCLLKQPHRRYASALELAADLRRFGAGEPIQARPVGRVERVSKWVRRRPAAAALIAAALLLVFGGSAAAVWYARDQAYRDAELQFRGKLVNPEVNAGLDEAEKHLHEVRSMLDDPLRVAVLLSEIDLWQTKTTNAAKALQRGQSASVGNEGLVEPTTAARFQAMKTNVEIEEKCYEWGKKLDGIRVAAVTPVDGKIEPHKAGSRYKTFFAEQGLDVVTMTKEQLAAAIQKSPIRYALVAALDHWAEVCTSPKYEDRQLLPLLLKVARAGDPDPWRDELRDPAAWDDLSKLTKLAEKVDASLQAPQTLVFLGVLLSRKSGNPAPVLQAGLLTHPRDYWLHYFAASIAADPREKIARCQAMIAIRPRNILGFVMLGNAFQSQKNPAAALSVFNKVINLEPALAGPYVNLGNALHDQKNLPGAVAAYNKAIELDPNDAVAHSNRGIALRDQKNLLGAIAAHNKAIELDPKYGAAYNNLGNALRDNKDFAGAIVAFNKAIELEPKLVQAHINLGNILRDQKNLPGAVAAFKAAIEIDRNFAQAYNDLGTALRDQKNQAEAIKAINRAIELDPIDAAIYRNLGNALHEDKDLPGAIGAFKKAIKIDPKFASAYNDLGIALKDLRDLDGAIAAFKSAVKFDPNNAIILNSLGAALMDQKDLSGAVAVFNEAIAIDPDYDTAHSNLAFAYQRQGKFEDALQEMRRAPGRDAKEWTERVERLLALRRSESGDPLPLESAATGVHGELRKNDPLDVFPQTMKSYRASHSLHLAGNHAYQIDVTGDFDVFLRVEDANYLTLACTDIATPPAKRTARLVFSPEKDGVYRVIITCAKPGNTGTYTLSVKEVHKATAGAIIKGQLTKESAPGHGGRFHDIHKVDLVAGRPYVFELASPRFDSFLVLFDSTGQKALAQNDNAGDFVLSSRIDFTPKESGTYLLVATTSQPGETGPYTLAIQGHEPAGKKGKK